MLDILVMQDVHLPSLDLNLLVALRALLTERHVTRAARHIGLTQPAMSHALARLRAATGDAILVRTPAGMRPTPRAEAMAEPLERALVDISRVLARPEPFDPTTSERRFVVATNDYVELVLVPSLLSRLWTEAPNVDIRLVNLGTGANEELMDGRVDVGIGPLFNFGSPPPRAVRAQKILEDEFVCVVREDHPVVKRRLTLDDFCALPHALVSPRGQGGSIVDTALRKIGRRRRVAVEIPHFLVAPHVVRETDVVLTLASRVARVLAPAVGLRQLPPPIELPGFSMSMVWHERQQQEPAHAWLRSMIARTAKARR
jgi:DNA-binding transcriptional LysR family regulator